MCGPDLCSVTKRRWPCSKYWLQPSITVPQLNHATVLLSACAQVPDQCLARGQGESLSAGVETPWDMTLPMWPPRQNHEGSVYLWCLKHRVKPCQKVHFARLLCMLREKSEDILQRHGQKMHISQRRVQVLICFLYIFPWSLITQSVSEELNGKTLG